MEPPITGYANVSTHKPRFWTSTLTCKLF